MKHPSLNTARLTGIVALTLLGLCPSGARAQGCVATRMDAPIVGAQGPVSCGPGQWQLSTAWRYFQSDRHFVGDVEQVQREEEGSQVINTVNLLDVSLRYYFNQRWSVTVGVPYMMAQRSSPIRDENREVIGRSITHGTGLGDIGVTAKRWMFDPMTSLSGNVSLGLGLKLRSGQYSQTDTRERYDETTQETYTSLETVDQSIQPGDGGFGILFDVLAFYRLAQGRVSLYASGTYLSNPEEENGVLTYRSRAAEAVMSVADQYVARVGGSALVPGTGNYLAVSLGGRIEGIPAEDLIGGSEGFRRPGYAVSVEPAVSIQTPVAQLDVAVPIAVYRNRVQSVPDKETDRHGDAAFADWVLLAGFTRTI